MGGWRSLLLGQPHPSRQLTAWHERALNGRELIMWKSLIIHIKWMDVNRSRQGRYDTSGDF